MNITVLGEIISGLATTISVTAAYLSSRTYLNFLTSSKDVKTDLYVQGGQIVDTAARHAKAAEDHRLRAYDHAGTAEGHAKIAGDHSQSAQTWSKASELHANTSAKHKDEAGQHADTVKGLREEVSLAAVDVAFMQEAVAGHANTVATSTEEVKQTAKIHKITVQASARCHKCGFRAAKYSVSEEGVVTCASCDNAAYKRSIGA
jgi:hypothetical protein